MTFRRPQQSTLVAEALANEADCIAYLWSQEPKTKTIPTWHDREATKAKKDLHGILSRAGSLPQADGRVIWEILLATDAQQRA